jgi:hypothetical protein
MGVSGALHSAGCSVKGRVRARGNVCSCGGVSCASGGNGGFVSTGVVSWSMYVLGLDFFCLLLKHPMIMSLKGSGKSKKAKS